MPRVQNKMTAMVAKAGAGGYGIVATCCYNLEGIIATVRAAEAKNSPAIIQLFPWAVEYADGLLVHAAAEAAKNAKVPVSVHMDHCQSPEMVKRAAEMGGFDGIMVDMSHYEKEENLARTRELVEWLHAQGIVTEAEPGRIEGGEDGVDDTADLEGLLTTPEQAEEFMALGIDWLAPAFGNVHGKYGAKGPKLDYARLQNIHTTTKGRVHLVLHGANEFKEEHFQKCIASGMVKCNINDAMNSEYTKVQREKAGKIPLTAVIEEGTNQMQKAVEELIQWIGSANKA